MNKIIIACKITPIRWKNEVHVTYDDGSTEMIFTYYPDEISYSEIELIGLTRDQANGIHDQKNISYIQRG